MDVEELTIHVGVLRTALQILVGNIAAASPGGVQAIAESAADLEAQASAMLEGLDANADGDRLLSVMSFSAELLVMAAEWRSVIGDAESETQENVMPGVSAKR